MVFAGTVLSGFADKSKVVRFEELDVQRLNLVEPDGTLRMVISDKARFPARSFAARSTRIRAPMRGCCSSTMKAPRTAD
jgi:hypothetical protein